MPSAARLASKTELERLVLTAEQAGFSRTAKGVSTEGSDDYVLMPYLRESDPVPSWICLVIGVPAGLFGKAAERPMLRFAKLDISLRDFTRLRRLGRRESAQLLHWLAYIASRVKDD